MHSDYHFTATNKNGDLLNFTVHINPEEIKRDKDCDLLIRRVISDAFKAAEELAQHSIHINITDLDIVQDSVKYQIIGDPANTIHEIAFRQFEKKKVSKEISQKQIISADAAGGEVGKLSLLERFAVVDQKPKGFFGKVLRVLSAFFSKLLYPFVLLQRLWQSLTGKAENTLPWDINLLAEICGTQPIEPMSMMHSLRYMSTMLDREKDETADPVLQYRFKNALKLAQEIDQTRQNYKEKDAKKIVSTIQKSLTEIDRDQKILVPVGFMNNGKLNEALLEVSQDPDGSYRVAFISALEEMRDLFDYEMDVEGGSRSLRREITNVSLKDLQAAIPTLIELQTTPNCIEIADDAAWKNIFLQTLRFENSKVEATPTTEQYLQKSFPGHLSEAISYVKGEQIRPEDAKRFELAIRLQLFLDVCKANIGGLRDSQFWTSVRTTARFLATEIEQNKALLGSTTAQGIELTRVYGELRQLLDGLDRSLPTLETLQNKELPLMNGIVNLVNPKETPDLVSVNVPSTVYPKIDPAFALFDPQEPERSIRNLGIRMRKLIEAGRGEEAAREAKLAVQVLPRFNDPIWQNLTRYEALSLLSSFTVIAEAIARGSVEKDQPSIQDLSTLTTVNFLAHTLAQAVNLGTPEELACFTINAHRHLDDLLNCHLPASELEKLQIMKATVPVIDEPNWYRFRDPSFQPLYDCVRFTQMALEGKKWAEQVKSTTSIVFPESIGSLDVKYTRPFALMAPKYAHDLSLEVTNRYVTEFCCFGCIRDNCPSYNRVNKDEQRFHPLYMLHNFVDIYTKNLTAKGKLKRDELTDLMYTQQTNQNANTVYEVGHRGIDGFDVANAFNEKDRQIQLMNTLMIYLDHPNFFKQPDLRWQFETKLFKFGTLKGVLNAPNFGEQEPFFNSMLKKLSREISVSNAAKDKETAAYLIHVCKEMQESIISSNLPEEKKKALIALMPKNLDQILNHWARELVSSNDEYQLANQMMVLPIMLENYYKKFIKNPQDPCFNSQKDLELILSAMNRIELRDRLKKMVDPELHDRYQSMMPFIFHKVREKVASEAVAGDFINKILMHLNPTVSALRLKWDPARFPTFTAIDSKGESYQFDLTTGVVSVRSKQTAEIPNDIKNDLTLKLLFGKALNEVWGIKGNKEKEDRNFDQEVEKQLENLFGKNVIQEYFENKKEKKSQTEQIISYTHDQFTNQRIVVRRPPLDAPPAPPKISIERMITEDNGKVHWLTYTEFDVQQCLRENRELPQILDIPVNVALAIGNRTCWMDINKENIYVYEVGNGVPYAVIKLKTEIYNVEPEIKEAGFAMKLLAKLSGNSGDAGTENEAEKSEAVNEPVEVTRIEDFHLIREDTHLLKASERDLEKYSTIEDPRFIQVFGKDNQPNELVFSRYELSSSGAPLSFDIGKEKISSKAYPDYHLASYGFRPGLKNPILGATPLPPMFDGLLLLRKEGDEKVLIPLKGFEPEYTLEGAILPTRKPVLPNGFDKCSLYEFSVDKETNRLVAKSGDAYAYLAYLCLAHGDHSSSAYYLSKARTTAGYDATYDQVFDWVEKWQDETPNGIAMKLRFEIFREKVLEDRHIQKIREGNLGEAEEILIGQAPRLIQIAELYEQYTDLVNTPMRGEKGVDPALELSNDDQRDVKKMVKTLIAAHGGEHIETNEPNPVRAKEIPPLEFLNIPGQEFLDLNSGVLGLWTYSGTDQNHGPFSMNNPLWIIQNFRDLFNRVIAADSNSLDYKQITQQVRMVSSMPQNKLSTVEVGAINTAQAMLLKLITLKETDQMAYDKVINELGPDATLDKLKGPFFKISRKIAFARASNALSNFDDMALNDYESMKEVAWNLWRTEGFDPMRLRKFGEQVMHKMSEWKDGANGKSLYENFKDYTLGEFFTPGGAAILKTMNTVFNLLEPVEIRQAKQTMQEPPAMVQVSQPKITYAEKYGKLLDNAPTDLPFQIEELQRKIEASAEPAPAALVVTNPAKVQAVIGDPLSKRLSKLFNIAVNPAPTIDQTVFDELSRSDEQTFTRVAEKHRADLAAYLSAKTTVSIAKQEAEEVRAELVAERSRITTEEEALKKNLLQCVDLFDTPAGILAMRRLIGQGTKPSLDFLISLWRRDEISKPWNENPLKKLGLKPMPEWALKKLDEDIGKYLELSTIHNHLNRIVDMANNYIKTCGSEYHSAGDVQLANEFFEGVMSKRNYALNSQDNADYRDLQYVEYTQKIIMYADQIATLREMTFDPNAVRQLRMGRGKTEVIMPLLAKKKATGKNLVVLMLPEELYEANCRGLDVKNRLLFGQEMHRFDFSLKTDKSVASLQQIQKRLLQTMHEKGFIMSTKRSLLSLKNSYLLFLNKLSKMGPHDDKSEIIAQIRELNKIVSLFYNHADVLADEVDACLDVRKEVNFALGEAERVDQVKGDVGADLMHLVIDQKPADRLYELKDVLIHNTQATIAPERRKALLADLVRLYFDKHRAAFPGVDKEQFISYILDDPNGAPVETWVFGQKVTNPPVFKQVAALKAFIDQGFGTTLGRLGNVNYGRDPITGVQTIPYKASNTASLNSEFDDDIERISFTYQDYIQNGVSYKQVYQIVARMQNQAIEQLRGSNSEELLSILDTQAARDFEAFVQEVDPENKLGSSLTLANMNDAKKIEALTAALNASTKGRIAFCHKQVVRNMQQFSAQINSMSTEAPQLVKNFSGFTGTPWNIHTYHDKIHAEANLGVDGMTWALLLGRPIDIKSFSFDADKPIESLLTNLDLVGNYQAVVDTGAYLRGTSNAQLIDQALEVAKAKKIPVQAGIYFDESGKIVKKGIRDKQAFPIETAPATDLMQTITLYDQAHTVGADIKQGKKAKAVVTIGENTFIRDLFQAVWRMRQLNQEQDVAFAVSDKIRERILGQDKRDLTIVDILKFCLMNESRREAEDNFKAEKEKIQGAVKRAVLPQIVNVIQGNASEETIVQMAKKFATDDAQLFVKLRAGEEAYDSYARIKTKEPPLDAFERLKVKESAKSQRISEEFKALRKEHASQQLDQLGKEIAKRPAPPESWFSNKVNSYDGAGGEVEQEAQAEVEQELELMLQTEMQTQTETVKEVNIPIMQSGEAGHGNVNPIQFFDLFQLMYRDYDDPSAFRNLSKGLPYFDPEIYLSTVFERNLSDEPAPPQSVFYSNRKPVKQVMIAKKQSNEMVMLIPTIHEAHGACKDYITQERLLSIVEVAISAGKPLVIYKTGGDRTDALPFTNKEDIDQFYRLYVQAKLFNGEIEFGSVEEQEALKKWLLSKGVMEFKNFFEQNILAAKPRRFADAYPNSTLFKIFNDLLEAPLAAG